MIVSLTRTTRWVLIAASVVVGVLAIGSWVRFSKRMTEFVIPSEYGRVPPSASTKPVEIDWFREKSGARLHMLVPKTYFSYIDKAFGGKAARSVRDNGIASFTISVGLSDLESPLELGEVRPRRHHNEGEMISARVTSVTSCALNHIVDRARADVTDKANQRSLYLAGKQDGFEIYRTMRCGKEADRLPVEARTRPGVPDGCADTGGGWDEQRLSIADSDQAAYLVCATFGRELCQALDEFRGWRMEIFVGKADLNRYREIRRLLVHFLENYVQTDSVTAEVNCR
jgi:hypothetical protein